MRYRGFEITVDREDDRFVIGIYAAEDLDKTNLFSKYYFSAEAGNTEEDALSYAAAKIEKDIFELELDKEDARRNILLRKLGNAVALIGNSRQDEELYHILTDELQMTDHEIQEIGFTGLMPFFDKDGYAKTIADYMTDVGVAETVTGDWSFDFSHLNQKFSVNLPEDRELLEKIVQQFDSRLVSDVNTSDGFDLRFNTDFCPYVYAEDEAEDYGCGPEL